MYHNDTSLPFVQSLRREIAALLSSGDVSITRAARRQDISVRTCQRRLAAAGLVYSRLVDEVRFDTARRLLDDPNMTLAEISAALGYAHPTKFTRAFERWTGLAPSVYRRECL